MKRFAYIGLFGLLLSTPLAAQITTPVIGASPITPTAITPDSIGGSSNTSIHKQEISAPSIIENSFSIDNTAISASPINPTAVSAQPIKTNNDFYYGSQKTSAPVNRNFDFNRFNRFSGGTAPGSDKPRVSEKPSIYRERNERAIRVQSLNPSIDGYEVTGGYTYAPDMNEDSWIWLPLGAR